MGQLWLERRKESPFDLLQTRYGWAQVLAYQGKLDDAIERWLVAKRIADESVPAMVPEMNRTLGLALFTQVRKWTTASIARLRIDACFLLVATLG